MFYSSMRSLELGSRNLSTLPTIYLVTDSRLVLNSWEMKIDSVLHCKNADLCKEKEIAVKTVKTIKLVQNFCYKISVLL